jgi:hypothetical protein
MFRTQPFVDARPFLDDAFGLRAAAAEQGYLFFRRLLEPDTVLALRRLVLEICHDFGLLAEGRPLLDGVPAAGVQLGAYDDRWVALQCRVVRLPAYHEVGMHPAILGVLEKLFEESVRPGRGSTCRLMSPGAAEFTTPPHQDCYYVRGSEALWTAWLPLGDCPRELGGLAVLPGSHRRGLLDHQGEGVGRQGVAVAEDLVWAAGDYACGDVLLFHGLTLHRAADNVSRDRLRLSVDYRYQPASHPLPGEPGA